MGRAKFFPWYREVVRGTVLLNKYRKEEHFQVIAYCLMNNHVHLLLHVVSGLARIMKRIAGSYAEYYNSKYEHTGHLFQDRFKSEPIDDERYLLTVVRYIHNNPPEAQLCAREDYPWSSWREYAGQAGFVSKELVFDLTGGYEGFLQMSIVNDSVECIEYRPEKRITDERAKVIIQQETGCSIGYELQNMRLPKRNEVLRQLKKRGLSVRQIERLTGIGRGIVLKA